MLREKGEQYLALLQVKFLQRKKWSPTEEKMEETCQQEMIHFQPFVAMFVYY